MRTHRFALVVVLAGVSWVGCGDSEVSEALPVSSAGSSGAAARAGAGGGSGSSANTGGTAAAPKPDLVKVTIDSGVLVARAPRRERVSRGALRQAAGRRAALEAAADAGPLARRAGRRRLRVALHATR